MSSGGELEEVESRNMNGFNTGNVSQSSDKWDIGTAVDDKRSSSGSESSVSIFSVSGSNFNSISNFLNICESSNMLKEFDSFFCSLDSFSRVINNQWEFRDLVNSVSSSLNQRKDSWSSNSGGNGEFFLLDVWSSVPSSPDSKRGKHSSLSTHVSECSLSWSACSWSTNTRNTGNSTTSSPRFSWVSHTSIIFDSLTLSSVLWDLGVNEVNDISSDSGTENSGKDNSWAGGVAVSLSFFLEGSPDANVLSMDHVVNKNIN